MNITKFIISDKAVRFILFQRTAYLKSPTTILYKILSRVFGSKLEHFAIKVESIFRKSSIKNQYFPDMKNEFMNIKEYLPNICNKSLDIGCGIAGVDVFLAYAKPESEIHLLDKTKTDKNVFYSFNMVGAFYNSLELAKEFLISNGVRQNKIKLIEANNKNTIDSNNKYDLIISLISWGFHYPVETYLNEAYKVLDNKGVLILDIRKDTDGLKILKNKFTNVNTILNTEKYIRVAAYK